MALYRSHEGPARFVALRTDSAISIQGKFRIDGHQFVVAEFDHGIRCFSAGKAVLHRVLRGGKGILEQAFERHFPQRATRLGATQNTFERLRGLGHLFTGLLHFAEQQLHLADLITRVLEFVSHLVLGVGSHLAGNLGGVFNGVLQGGGHAIETLRDALGDGF